MRVITGTAGGRKLKTLEGDATRPTADKVKEGVFSAIQFDIEGRRVLDLFAGSGQLGIEALSRGARSVVFCDSNPDAVKVIRSNLQTTGFEAQSKVVNSGFEDLLRSAEGEFDIAFIDPPYASGLLEKAARLTADVMSDYGIMICEHDARTHMPEQIGKFTLKKRYGYGKTAVSLYRVV